jgi:hypothetical protein
MTKITRIQLLGNPGSGTPSLLLQQAGTTYTKLEDDFMTVGLEKNRDVRSI